MKSLLKCSSVFPSLCLLAGVFTSVAWAQTATLSDAAQARTQSAKTGRPIAYIITDLGIDSAGALNNHGQVVGSSLPSPDSSFPHAFLWQDGKATDLGTLGGIASYGQGINDNGQVVGAADTAGVDSYSHAFVWENGKMTDIDPLEHRASQATGINNEAQVVGSANVGCCAIHAFLWQGNQKTDLGIFRGSDGTWATAINNKGQVVGASHDQPFLWQDGKLTNLGRLGGHFAYAEAINNEGQVVGMSNAPPFDPKTRNFPYHPFLWQDGKMTDLGPLCGDYSSAGGINDSGQIVGGCKDFVALWQDGRIENLNKLVFAAADWTLYGASGINNLGQITGTGLHNGQQRGFLLTPLPPGPGSGKLSLSSNSWTFSPHPAGRTSGSATVYLTNTGSGDLHILQITTGALSASDTPGDFRITTDTCFPPGTQHLSQPVPITLAPHEFCTIVFNFTPAVGGARHAAIVVYDDAPDGPHAIPVNGVGTGKGILVFSQTSWTFGHDPVGKPSGPGVIYAYNSGTEPINFSDISILNTDFTLTSDTCSPTLAHHATCAVSFVFTPSGTGISNADLTFTDDSAISTQTIPLTGYGR